MTEQEKMQKQLRGCVAKMDRLYKRMLKRAAKEPDKDKAQADLQECRSLFGY